MRAAAEGDTLRPMFSSLNRSNLLSLSLGSALALSACASNDKKDTKTAVDAKSGQPEAAVVDKSRCEPAGKKVVELDINNDKKPDVWKFYVKVAENGAQVDALTCKEVDVNFDGHKDIWVFYDGSGNIAHEEFDLDFDGKVDLQTFRQQGKVIRQELDTNFDGKTDVWKFYENEKLARIERSSKANGRVDVWEYYEGGKLDRIGYDSTGAGRVDRWERAPEEAPDGSGAAGPATPNAPPPPATTPAPAATPAATAPGNAPPPATTKPRNAPTVTPESSGK